MEDFNNDLIRRTDALNAVHNFFEGKLDKVMGDRHAVPMGEMQPVLKDNKELAGKIKAIPRFEVQGEWIDDTGCLDSVKQYKCSACGGKPIINMHYVTMLTDFCPHCGANMKVVE